MDTPRPLDQALSELVSALSDLGARKAVPTMSGDLLLVFSGPDRTRRVVLSVRRHAGGLSLGDLSLYAAAQDLRWAERIAARLGEMRRAGIAGWLDLHNRELPPLEPDPFGLWRCLAWQVVPQAPFFESWTLESVTFLGRERPGFRLSLCSSGDSDRRLALALDASGRCGAGETPLAKTPLGLLTRMDPHREADPVRSGSAASPEAALAFILTLSAPPGIAWAQEPAGEPPEPPAAPPDRPGREDDSLIVHSYRTDHEWGEPRSRFFGTWGDRDFFILLALVDHPSATVFHGNRECQQVRQPLSDRFAHGANPFIPARREWAWLAHETHFTDTDDQAAVFGGEERLQRVLSDLKTDAPDREVRVLLGCDAEMVGDDVPYVCRMASREGRAVECFNPPLPRFTDALARNWWAFFVQGRDRSVTPDPAAIALAGFQWPAHPDLVEVEGLLAESGVRVALRMLPGQSPDIRSALGGCAATIASPWHPVQQVLGEVLKAEGLRVESFPMPYGERGARRWLDEVLSALGLPRVREDRWRSIVSRLAPDLPAMRREAARLRVGLAADWGRVPEMVSPAFFYGLDPVDFLTDLGLHVVLLGPAATEAARQNPVPGHAVEALDLDHEQVPAQVREAGLDLVYCDRNDPASVAALQAVPFGIADLEFGLSGAQRTLGRLLARARLRLHRRICGMGITPWSNVHP